MCKYIINVFNTHVSCIRYYTTLALEGSLCSEEFNVYVNVTDNSTKKIAVMLYRLQQCCRYKVIQIYRCEVTWLNPFMVH